MLRYALLNLVVLAIIGWSVRRLWTTLDRRRAALTLAILLLLTAVFDNAIIAAGLVDYSPNHYLGLRLGLAPIEDFAYSVAAVLLLPALWERKANHE